MLSVEVTRENIPINIVKLLLLIMLKKCHKKEKREPLVLVSVQIERIYMLKKN